MLTYKYTKPIYLENRPQSIFDNPDFILTIATNNLMQGQCSASIIKNTHLRNFFTNDSIKEEVETTYTEAAIYNELCSNLLKYIISNKDKGYKKKAILSQMLLNTSFSVDSETRTITLKTSIKELYNTALKIAKEENFSLDRVVSWDI